MAETEKAEKARKTAPTDIRDLMLFIEETYGAGTIRSAARGKGFKLTRFSTMIFDLDVAIGGGIPWGRFMRVYGPFSGGKSSLYHKAVASAQNYCRYCRVRFRLNRDTGELSCDCPLVCPDCKTTFKKTEWVEAPGAGSELFRWGAIHDDWMCECLVQPSGTKAKRDRVAKITPCRGGVRTVWVDFEHAYDADWAARLCVDNDMVFVTQPEYAEQGIDIVDALLRSGAIDIMVIDSIADMTPADEISESAESWQRGLQARIVNKAMRRWSATINALGSDTLMVPCILLVNQTRDSMERGEVTPGGWQQYFKSSIDIRLDPARYAIKEHKSGSGPKWKETLYADTRGVVKKNKTAKPMQEFSYRFYVSRYDGQEAGSTNEFRIVFDRSLEFGVIKRTGKSKDEYVYGDHSWKTQVAAIQDLADDENLFWGMRNKTMELALALVRGEWVPPDDDEDADAA